MDFRLDEGQVELQQTVARFCADRFPLDDITARDGHGVDRVAWREMADLGVFGLLRPEDRGGSGLGVVEGAILFEQLGSHLVPGPVLWSVLAAPFVDAVAGGSLLVGGIEVAQIDERGGAVVEHAQDLDVLLVIDRAEIVACRTADLPPPAPMTPLDPLTPVGRFDRVVGGERVGDATDAANLRALGTVLVAALLVGVAARALEVARAYALEREQFGVAIGSFQAVKHLLADMYVRTGLAQSAVYAAAAMLDGPSAVDASRLIAGAKLLAGRRRSRTPAPPCRCSAAWGSRGPCCRTTW